MTGAKGRKPSDIQNPQQKYTCQSEFLSLGGVQAPNHGDRKAENEDVCQEIQYAAGDGKTRQVDAFCVVNSSIPEGGHRSALKDGCQSKTEPLAKDNYGANTNGQAKALGWREESIIEQQEGCFCGSSGG